MIRVFIDGREGTTGLQIQERLSARPDVELLILPEDKRKDTASRQDCLNRADVAFLCLPDAAAREAAALVTNPDTILIDASTAHRTQPGWVYGLPELSAAQRSALASAKRIANPGCHATGFILAVRPLIAQGLLSPAALVTCTSLTGYSGGGKALIAQYEGGSGETLQAPRPYALNLTHKHLPEMTALSGLINPPHFTPVVGPIRQGMLVSVPLFAGQLTGNPGARDVHALLADTYAHSRFVSVMPFGGEGYLSGGFLDPAACNGTNRLEIFVFGHEAQILIVSRLDNLGKGASGAAVQNMNIARGLPEDLYLE